MPIPVVTFACKKNLLIFVANIGFVAEWLGSGLQNRPQRFDSARNLREHKRDAMFYCVPFHFQMVTVFFVQRKRGKFEWFFKFCLPIVYQLSKT